MRRVDREGVAAGAEVDGEELEPAVGDAHGHAQTGDPVVGEFAGVGRGVAGVVDGEQVVAGDRAGAGSASHRELRVDVVDCAARVGPGGVGGAGASSVGADGDAVGVFAGGDPGLHLERPDGDPVAAGERVDLHQFDARVGDAAEQRHNACGRERDAPDPVGARVGGRGCDGVEDEVVGRGAALDHEAVAARGVEDVDGESGGPGELDPNQVVAGAGVEVGGAGPRIRGERQPGHHNRAVEVADEHGGGAVAGGGESCDGEDVLEVLGHRADAEVEPDGQPDDEQVVVEAEVHALERLHQRVRAAVVEEGVAAKATGGRVVAATEVEDVVEARADEPVVAVGDRVGVVVAIEDERQLVDGHGGGVDGVVTAAAADDEAVTLGSDAARDVRGVAAGERHRGPGAGSRRHVRAEGERVRAG